ncbi:hypothetical protein ACOBV8_03635 [Pseudoalteromonas espejiana]
MKEPTEPDTEVYIIGSSLLGVDLLGLDLDVLELSSSFTSDSNGDWGGLLNLANLNIGGGSNTILLLLMKQETT